MNETSASGPTQAGEGGASPDSSTPPRMSWRKQFLLAGIMLAVGVVAFGPGRALITGPLAAAGLIDGASAEDKGARKPGAGGQGGRSLPTVVLAEASAAMDDLELKLVGGAIALRSAELKPRASGRVTEVLFEAGDALKAGEPLLRLEDRRETLALERAEVTLTEAERRRERARKLRGAGSGSEAALDTAETEAEIARISRDEAREALDDRTVVAPFDGVVSLPNVEIGDRIEPSATIASLDDRSVLLVEVAAPETAFGRLSLHTRVSATTAAFPQESFEGRIAEIDSRIDAGARTIIIRAEIPNKADRLRPGMSFTLSLNLPGEAVVATPEIALQWERDGAYVWRVKDGVSERVSVQLIARQDGSALVRNLEGAEAPLEPGDKVVVEGVQRLKHGRKVRVLGAGDGPSGGRERGGPRGEAPAESRLKGEAGGGEGDSRLADRMQGTTR